MTKKPAEIDATSLAPNAVNLASNSALSAHGSTTASMPTQPTAEYREQLRKHIAAIDGRRPQDAHSDRGFAVCPHPDCVLVRQTAMEKPNGTTTDYSAGTRREDGQDAGAQIHRGDGEASRRQHADDVPILQGREAARETVPHVSGRGLHQEVGSTTATEPLAEFLEGNEFNRLMYFYRTAPRTSPSDINVAFEVVKRAIISASHGSAPEPQFDMPRLDEQYLGHLREAAFDWGIEKIEGEPVVARRAAIWLGRNVVTLIDELRKLRSGSAPEAPDTSAPFTKASATAPNGVTNRVAPSGGDSGHTSPSWSAPEATAEEKDHEN